MISKDELVKNVAEKCGVPLEISSFFFEVFINRVSNKLKPGETIQFDNYGYFSKRNCRIHLEKSADSPAAKAYLLQLILFALEPKVKGDLTSVHFLKIPNLKSLWIDDKEFQNSLKAGDFYPHTERDQLIKAFATKAEVILGGLRKDYDSELENELSVPLTFDLNFLIKSGKKSSPTSKIDAEKVDSKIKEEKKDKNKTGEKTDELSEDGLPWNYGTKFLEKNKSVRPTDDSLTMRPEGRIDPNIQLRKESDISSEKRARLNEFEPVHSHLSTDEVEKDSPEDVDTIKFILAKTLDKDKESSAPKSFTEVRSKTGASIVKEDWKNKKSGSTGRLSETRLKYKSYKQSRNYLPLIILFAFVIIAGAAIYYYFFRGDGIEDGSEITVYDIKPPSNVNVIERDYEFAVTYPYPKIEFRNEISGYNPDAFLVAEVKPEIVLDKKPEIKPDVKPIVKSEKTNIVKEQPDTKENIPTLVVEKPEKQETIPDLKEESRSRIFLYKNYYVVYVGSFNSSEVANREADKYFDLGYNAFIEVLERRGGKTLYKLNVGDFTSEEFARDFESKYLKK